jgi:hypothetical protein
VTTDDDTWPEGHAEFVAYCDAHPEATRDLTPFGWWQAGLQAGRHEYDALIAEAMDAAKADRINGAPL